MALPSFNIECLRDNSWDYQIKITTTPFCFRLYQLTETNIENIDRVVCFGCPCRVSIRQS